MLVATLLFEKKISQTQASLSLAAIVFLSGIIDGAIDVFDPSVPETRTLGTFNAEVARTTHVYEIAVVSLCFFILKGLWMYFQSKDAKTPVPLRSTKGMK